jgi:hypothetical protein
MDDGPKPQLRWWRCIETPNEKIVGFEPMHEDEDPKRVLIGEFILYTAMDCTATRATLIDKETGERWEYYRIKDSDA